MNKKIYRALLMGIVLILSLAMAQAARLPVVGADANNWGAILNGYLTQSLTANGTLKDNIVNTTNILDNAVTDAKINNVSYSKLIGAPTALSAFTNNVGYLTTESNPTNATILITSSQVIGLGTSDSPTFTGLTLSGLTTSNTVLISGGSKAITSSAVTNIELGYLSGVTSSIQAQLNNKQPLNSELTAIGSLSSDGIIKRVGGVYSTITDNSANWDTAYTDRFKWDGGLTGLNAATGRSSLGLGGLATLSAVGSAEITDNQITASDLAAGDFSSKINSGTYSININGNAAIATTATSATSANSATTATTATALAVDGSNCPAGQYPLGVDASGNAQGCTVDQTSNFNQNNVAITGGTINGATIGGTTPAAGTFTTLSASSTVNLGSLTASQVVATDGSKNLVSLATTGTGNAVLATSPTLTTPNIGAASATSINIGSGTTILKHLSNNASIDIPSISANTCDNTTTINVSGAAPGDTVVATPTPATGGIETLKMTWNAYVSTANTVAIHTCAFTNNQNPAAQTWRVDVWKH